MERTDEEKLKNAEAVRWLLDHNLMNVNLVHILSIHPEAYELLPLIQNSSVGVFSESDLVEFAKKLGVKIGTN